MLLASTCNRFGVNLILLNKVFFKIQVFFKIPGACNGMLKMDPQGEVIGCFSIYGGGDTDVFGFCQKEFKKPFKILRTGKMEIESLIPLDEAAQAPENSNYMENVSVPSDSAPQNAGSQVLVAPQHSDGSDSMCYSHPNAVTLFSSPLYYLPPMFYPSVCTTFVHLHGWAQQYHPGCFPTVEPQAVNFGTESLLQSQLHPAFCGGLSASGSYGHHLPADSNARVNSSSYRRHDQQEANHFSYPLWYHQGAITLNDNRIMPQEIGQMVFSGPPPPIFGPVPGLTSRGILGPGPLSYLFAAAPSFRAVPPTHLMPHPSLSMAAPEALHLRSKIVKQIEYYFSDKNLPNDHYLLSLMDVEGWVPISCIANFNRVKKMTRDIPFIVDALKSSLTIEIQGDKIRKHCDYSRLASFELGTTTIKSGSPKDQVSIYATTSVDKYQDKEYKKRGLIGEGLELDRSAVTRHCFLPSQRAKDEDNKVAASDQDVQRLVSLTQEQRLKRTDKIRKVWVKKRGDSTYCNSPLGLQKTEVTGNIAGSSCSGEPRHANMQRRENRGLKKKQCSHKQFLTSSKFQNHGNSHNLEGMISGFQASSSVGFSFGLMPVKRSGLTSSKSDPSSKGNLPKNNPLLHSNPKVSSTYKSSASRKWVLKTEARDLKYKRCFGKQTQLGIGCSELGILICGKECILLKAYNSKGTFLFFCWYAKRRLEVFTGQHLPNGISSKGVFLKVETNPVFGSVLIIYSTSTFKSSSSGSKIGNGIEGSLAYSGGIIVIAINPLLITTKDNQYEGESKLQLEAMRLESERYTCRLLQ
ncbi:la-related protein 1A-like isoform X3 [Actinidia eriantha]|uniref:la-related protein 1A-like isoform X3 n=1 Tax=Actinidia eriantha TaxID=165200 RepID=UPI002590AA3D|nr:la-related protein 1A-like isoform X3 [Actinidia eriantha]